MDTLTQNIDALEEQYKQLQGRMKEQQAENDERRREIEMTPEQRSEKHLRTIRIQQDKAEELT